MTFGRLVCDDCVYVWPFTTVPIDLPRKVADVDLDCHTSIAVTKQPGLAPRMLGLNTCIAEVTDDKVRFQLLRNTLPGVWKTLAGGKPSGPRGLDLQLSPEECVHYGGRRFLVCRVDAMDGSEYDLEALAVSAYVILPLESVRLAHTEFIGQERSYVTPV